MSGEPIGVAALHPPPPALLVEPLLGDLSAAAHDADTTRHLNPDVVAAMKANDVVRLAASHSIGGLDGSVLQIGRELEAVAAACASSAWVLWNHLSVFHLFAGTLGPGRRDQLHRMVAAGETVCFGAGAGSGVRGVIDGDHIVLNGRAAFGSGSRYADWSGIAFLVVDAEGQRVEPLDLRFTIVRLDDPAVTIDETWDGSGVRASATDDIHYRDLRVPLSDCEPWYGANRAGTLREAPVVDHRYREDWVGLSDLWLAWMGVGLATAALDEVVAAVGARRSILGARMETHPTVQRNLGEAASLITAAAATAEAGCAQVDARIAAAQVPTEDDYLRQMAQASAALRQLALAMDLMQRSQGGNGLRESQPFERRYRDFQPMPLHINAHPDRVDLRLGRHLLGEPQDAF